MQNKKDIYIRILEIGIDLNGGTISFESMMEKIRAEYGTLASNQVVPIRRWFYDYFYHPETFRVNRTIHASALTDWHLQQHDTEACSFTGDGYYRYIQYQELQTANFHANVAVNSAKKSSRIALVAVLTTLVSLLFQIFFSLNLI